MKILAIKGHTTRGKEVIEILEMLGGTNRNNCLGIFKKRLYIINAYGDIEDISLWDDSKYQIYTLEEFLEKYPYKVGDKVNSPCKGCIKTITSMEWDTYLNGVTYKLDNRIYTNIDQLKVFNDLQPHKKAPMYLNEKANKQSEEIKKTIEAVKEISELNLNHPVFKGSNEIEIIIPDGWEFKQRDNKMFGVRKQPQYPKTYKDCCDVLDLSTMDNDAKGYKGYLIIRFQELIIARDAYWKIAGEQMGLDKPWEPDWDNLSTNHEFIKINKGCFTYSSRVLVFPTEEMRDAFYENFKDLIEECKTFL